MVLARFFAWLDRVLGVEPRAPALVSPLGRPLPMPVRSQEPHAPRFPAALLSVDGGGQVLVVGAERLTLGHLRGGRADLAFLADLGAEHAVLSRSDSLQEGPGWRIEPCGRERVTLDGRAVPPGGRRVAPAKVVRLGENLEFRLVLPDDASASAVLELLHGAQCAGAERVLLLAPGRGGRARIGPSAAHHVRVPGLAFELALEWLGHELELHSEEPLSGALEGTRGRLAFPPTERQVLSAGAPRGSRPPFGLSLEPFRSP